MQFDDDQLRARLESPDGEWRGEDGLRDAAVLAVVRERDGVDHVIFTLRRADLRDHAGQVSFPGGSRDADEDAVACALRETQEEIGLDPEDLTVMGRLPNRFSIAGFMVAPFVARLVHPRDYAVDVSEVAEVFEVPLPMLLDPTHWEMKPITRPGRRYPALPYFHGGDHTVWGLTGVITADLLRITADFDVRGN